MKFAKSVFVFNRCSFTFGKNLKTLNCSSGLVKNSFSNSVEKFLSKFLLNRFSNRMSIFLSNVSNSFAQFLRIIFSLKFPFGPQTVPTDTENAVLSTGQRFFIQVSKPFHLSLEEN